jgi:hypothetical protein
MSAITDVGVVENSVAEIHDNHLHYTAGDVLAVDPSTRAIEQLVDVLTEHDDPVTVRVLAAESALKAVADDFGTAATAADLIENDTLELRATEGTIGNSLLLTGDVVVSIVPSAETVAGLTTRDNEFVADAHEQYESAWRSAEEFTLRTPPLSCVGETLSEELGTNVREDFDAALDSIENTHDGEELDGVTLSLLVAANNEALLYDTSKCGEDAGVASKATFSRVKTTLEEAGLVETEKVPIDVGRPRLRLLFGEERLAEADASQLPHVARELLADDDT